MVVFRPILSVWAQWLPAHRLTDLLAPGAIASGFPSRGPMVLAATKKTE